MKRLLAAILFALMMASPFLLGVGCVHRPIDPCEDGADEFDSFTQEDLFRMERLCDARGSHGESCERIRKASGCRNG